MNRFDILIKECDSAIRAGRSQEVARDLARLKGSRIPREYRLPLARICRRAGFLASGLRLLSRLANTGDAATSEESAEFALLLLRGGAVRESVERLSHIDSKAVPDALLFRAYGCFALWEYQEAIPFLQEFTTARLSPTALLLGRTNLAFAHMESRQHAQALDLLDGNIHMAREQKNLNLECYNHAVCAQVHIQEGRFDLAVKSIVMATRDTAKSQSHDRFFVTKMQLVLQAFQERSVQPLVRLRELALARHDWFALRDADFYSLKVKWDLEKFLYLYFGSPFERFRECLHAEFDCLPNRDTFVLGEKQAPRFDLLTGKVDDKVVIDVGGKCHQVIEVMLRDFYQPLTVAGLHSALFPGVRFDIMSSPDRVRQLIRRTRQWIAEARIPVSIVQDSGFYSFVMQNGFSVRIPLERHGVSLQSLQMLELQSHFGPAEIFSRQDLCRKLKMSNSSAHRFLRTAIEMGRIELLGPLKRPTGYRLIVDEIPHSHAA